MKIKVKSMEGSESEKIMLRSLADFIDKNYQGHEVASLTWGKGGCVYIGAKNNDIDIFLLDYVRMWAAQVGRDLYLKFMDKNDARHLKNMFWHDMPEPLIDYKGQLPTWEEGYESC